MVDASPDPTDFPTCPIGGAGLAPGAVCGIGVNFTPTALGTLNGTLTFTSNAVSPKTISLVGTGQAGLVGLSPTQAFPGTQVGTQSTTTGTATLTNNNTVAMTVYSVTPSGDFATFNDNCSGNSNLVAGGTCTVGVTFTPTQIGTRTGTLSVVSNARNATASSPGIIKLQGTGSNRRARVQSAVAHLRHGGRIHDQPSPDGDDNKSGKQ